MTDKITRCRYYIESLCIYDIRDDELMQALLKLLRDIDKETILVDQSRFFNLVAKHGGLKRHISRCILACDNAFTRAAAAGKEAELSQAVMNGVTADLGKLEELASLTADDIILAVEDKELREVLKTIPKWESGEALAPLDTEWHRSIEALCAYHRENGYGMYARYIAFTWRNREICPVSAIDPIRLDDLKNYENQRQRVIDNTESFLAGHPANNVLLYGDRGTGKSSTVHAILNEYHSRGLRMIEIPKSAVADLTLIREQLAGSPMKFIIYIDDLSFDSNDDSFSELKAALEGSLSGKLANILIYATSNRRHLIRESFSDRENDINRNDIMQEQLSLSDRFGLSITFINPNKQEYLDIVMKIAADRGLDGLDTEHLCAMADRWATRRGGRSPRCAKQFVDYVESCHKQGREW